MKLLFSLLGLLVLASCVDEYGKDTLDFVENRVPSLSLRIAESGYEKKIAQGYVLEYTKLIMESRNIFSHIERHNPRFDIDIQNYSMDTAQVVRAKLINNEDKLLKVKSHLLTIQNEQQALENICDEMNEYYLKSVVQQEIFNIAVPKKVEEYYVGTDMVGMVIRNVMSQFSSNNQAKQNAMMEEAISKIPGRIASVAELKKVYRKKCLLMKEAFKAQEEIKLFHAMFDDVLKSLDRAIILTQRSISIVGSKIYQLAYKDLSKRYGVDAIDEAERKEELYTTFNQIYAVFVQQDFSLMKKIITSKDLSSLGQAKEDWDKSFRERSLFLVTVKEVWPFYHEKNKETINRLLLVTDFCRTLSGKLQ